jgi:dihydroceramidase
MQLADELPMIYTVCIMTFATFSYKKSVKLQVLIATSLIGLAAFITVSATSRRNHPQASLSPQVVQIYYLYAKDPVFHQVAYGLITVGTIFRGFYVMECILRPALKRRNPGECGRLMRQMWMLALTGESHPST